MRKVVQLLLCAFVSLAHAAEEVVIVDDNSTPKKKSRYDVDAAYDINGDRDQGEYVSFESPGEIVSDNYASLRDVYIEMLHKYPNEYKDAVIRIYDAARLKRKENKEMVSRYGTTDVDPIPKLCTDIEDYFASKAQEVELPGSFRALHDATKQPQSKEQMQQVFQKLVKAAVVEVLKDEKEEIPVEDSQAIEDTAMLFGQFLTTQAKHGMDPNPQELVSFLGEIDFISLAPIVAGCLSRTFNCGPQATRRTQVCCMVSAIILTAGFYALGLAIQFGAFDDASSIGK